MATETIVQQTAREVDGKLVLLDVEYDLLRALPGYGEVVHQFLSADGVIDRDLAALLNISTKRDRSTITFTLPVHAVPAVTEFGGPPADGETARVITLTASRAKWRNSSRKRFTGITVAAA